METLLPQGFVHSTRVVLLYRAIKNNVSVAQTDLVMKSESAISARVFFSLFVWVFLRLESSLSGTILNY